MSQYTFVTADSLLQYAPASKGPVYVQQGGMAGIDSTYTVARNSNGTVSLGRVVQNPGGGQVLTAAVASDQWGRPAPQRAQDAPRAVNIAGYSSQPVYLQQGVQYIKTMPHASSGMAAMPQLKGVQIRSNVVGGQQMLSSPSLMGTTQQLVQVPQLPEGYYLVKSTGAGGQQAQQYSVVQQAPRNSTVAAAAAAALATTNVAAGPRQQQYAAHQQQQQQQQPNATLLPAEYVRLEAAQPGVQYVRAGHNVLRAAAPRQAQLVAAHQLAPRPMQQVQQVQLVQQQQRLQQMQQIRVAAPQAQAMHVQQQGAQLRRAPGPIATQQQQQQQQQQRPMTLVQLQQAPPGMALPRPSATTTLKAQIAIDANGNRVVLPGGTLPAGYTLAHPLPLPAEHHQPQAGGGYLQRIDAGASPALGDDDAARAAASTAQGDNQSICFDPAAAPRLGVIGDGKRAGRPLSEGGSPRSTASGGPPSAGDSSHHGVRVSVPASPEHGGSATGASSPGSDAAAGLRGVGMLAAPPGVGGTDAHAGGAVDQHALLCNLGQRFAQLGLSVEQAISSGLVSGLSAQQFKVFAEAHAVELAALAAAPQPPAYGPQPDALLLLPDSLGALASSQHQPQGLLGLPLLEPQPLQQQGGAGAAFNAFSYGFFCDVPAAAAAPLVNPLELLGPLEDEGSAGALEPEGSGAGEPASGGAGSGSGPAGSPSPEGDGSWGSGAASQDGQGCGPAGPAPAGHGEYDAMDAKLEQLYLGASFF
jgi:hypothetical protein